MSFKFIHRTKLPQNEGTNEQTSILNWMWNILYNNFALEKLVVYQISYYFADRFEAQLIAELTNFIPFEFNHIAFYLKFNNHLCSCSAPYSFQLFESFRADFFLFYELDLNCDGHFQPCSHPTERFFAPVLGANDVEKCPAVRQKYDSWRETIYASNTSYEALKSSR